MSFPIVRTDRQTVPTRRHPGRCALAVESLEAKALLTGAAASAAIVSLQQADSAVHGAIAAEVATLRSNIVTIQQSTQSFLSTLASGDKTDRNNAIRDEKYGIGQQLFLIGELGKTLSQYDSTIKYAIGGVKHGKIDPAYVPDVIFTGVSNLQAEIGTVDFTATGELDGLTATFAGGNT